MGANDDREMLAVAREECTHDRPLTAEELEAIRIAEALTGLVVGLATATTQILETAADAFWSTLHMIDSYRTPRLTPAEQAVVTAFGIHNDYDAQLDAIAEGMSALAAERLDALARRKRLVGLADAGEGA